MSGKQSNHNGENLGNKSPGSKVHSSPNSGKVEGSGESKDNTTEIRAVFTSSNSKQDEEGKSRPQTSPLLSSTPPSVAKSLVRSYPYLLIVNKFLSIITWTNDDYWINIILVCLYSLAILYFENLVTWLGHLIIVGIITLYALLNNKIIEETNLHPTLDDVVQALTTTCIKADMLLNPITSLSLTAYDIKRLLFTTVFLTPLYLIVTFLLVKPRIILLFTGLHILTYHSSYSRVARKMLWKIKLVRVLCFYLTGLDFLQARNHSLFAAAFAKVHKNAGHSLDLSSEASNKPVRFTYVIYENQRRWLGIGWTSNLLSYERTPWTDEFLNESSSIESFQLPNNENNDYSFGAQQSQQLTGSDTTWRWVDKTWRLDLTNDGAITLQNNKRSKTTANPATDEGYIYYDNTWKKPSTEDSFSKYTRRRRWIRTAELVFNGSSDKTPSTEEEISSNNASIPGSSNSTTGAETGNSTKSAKKRKSLRFVDPESDTTHEKSDGPESLAQVEKELAADEQDTKELKKGVEELTSMAQEADFAGKKND